MGVAQSVICTSVVQKLKLLIFRFFFAEIVFYGFNVK